MKLQIHLLEKECTQLSDVIAHIISLMLDLYLEGVIPKSLFVCVCTQLYADTTIGSSRDYQKFQYATVGAGPENKLTVDNLKF